MNGLFTITSLIFAARYCSGSITAASDETAVRISGWWMSPPRFAARAMTRSATMVSAVAAATMPVAARPRRRACQSATQPMNPANSIQVKPKSATS